jgi:hypothetical protein
MTRNRKLTVMVSVVASVLVLFISTTLVYSSDKLGPLLNHGIFDFVCNTSAVCVAIHNSGAGFGLESRTNNIAVYGISPSGSGAVRGHNSSTVAGRPGIYGRSPGGIGVFGLGSTACCQSGGYFTAYDGARGVATGGSGYGLWGTSPGASGRGVYGSASGSSGYGVYGFASGASGHGGYFISNQYRGVTGHSAGTNVANSYGGYFTSARRGLFANGFKGSTGTPNYYDGFFPDWIRVGTTNISSAGMSMMAVNNGSEALAPGDVVAFNGFVAVDNASVLAITKANGANNGAIIGVVQNAYQYESHQLASEETAAEPRQAEADPLASLEVPEGEEPLPVEVSEAARAAEAATAAPPAEVYDAGYIVEGNAEPGQHLIVLIQGIAKVNVDASTRPVRAGDTLIASGSGFAVSDGTVNASPREDDDNSRTREGADEPSNEESRSLSVAVIGRALESLEGGTGSVYVLVGSR